MDSSFASFPGGGPKQLSIFWVGLLMHVSLVLSVFN